MFETRPFSLYSPAANSQPFYFLFFSSCIFNKRLKRFFFFLWLSLLLNWHSYSIAIWTDRYLCSIGKKKKKEETKNKPLKYKVLGKAFILTNFLILVHFSCRRSCTSQVYQTWSQHRPWVGSASLPVQTNPVSLSIIFAACYNHSLCNSLSWEFGQLRASFCFRRGFAWNLTVLFFGRLR